MMLIIVIVKYAYERFTRMINKTFDLLKKHLVVFS